MSINHVITPPDHVIVPKVYFVPDSELSDETGTSTTGSGVTVRDSYTLEVGHEPMPFLWAQSMFYSAKLLRERGREGGREGGRGGREGREGGREGGRERERPTPTHTCTCQY